MGTSQSDGTGGFRSRGMGLLAESRLLVSQSLITSHLLSRSSPLFYISISVEYFPLSRGVLALTS